MEKIVDRETKHIEEAQNEDAMQYIHDFQLKAGGVLVQTEMQVKKLSLQQPFKLEVLSPPPGTEEGAPEEYAAASTTGFGQPTLEQAG